MTKKTKEEAIYKYSSIALKTYVLFAGAICFLTGFTLKYYLNPSYIDLLKIIFNLLFEQLSFILGVGLTLVATDVLMFQNINEDNEDFSTLKLLQVDNKKVKLEIILGVLGINFFIVGTKLEEWISKSVKGDLISVPEIIIKGMFTIGFTFLVIKSVLYVIRIIKYKESLKNK